MTVLKNMPRLPPGIEHFQLSEIADALLAQIVLILPLAIADGPKLAAEVHEVSYVTAMSNVDPEVARTVWTAWAVQGWIEAVCGKYRGFVYMSRFLCP